jgi:hypothetical protein
MPQRSSPISKGPSLAQASHFGHEPKNRDQLRGITMDYGKSGAPKKGKNTPRHSEHNAKGSDQNPFGTGNTKAELLARMKAAAEAKKSQD